MDLQITIKEEPIDYMDEDNEQHQQEQIGLERDIKIEYDESVDAAPAPEEAFNIVEEGSGVITISAADLKSEDEKNFLKRMNSLLGNGKITEDKLCSIPFTVIPDLKIKEEPMQEKKDIHAKDLTCVFCKQIFGGVNLLLQHMTNEHRSLKEFVCSSCRKAFHSFVELSCHWKSTNHSCTLSLQNMPNTKTKSDRKKLYTVPIKIKKEPNYENTDSKASDNIEIIEFSSSKYPAHIRKEVLKSDMSIISGIQLSTKTSQRPAILASSNINETSGINFHNKVNTLSKPKHIIETLKDGNRKVILSKPVINVIENLPEKRELIRNMQEQIKNVEANPSETSTRDSQEFELQEKKDAQPSPTKDGEKFIPEKMINNSFGLNSNLEEPQENNETDVPSLFLTLEMKFDPELAKVRFKYPDYRFQWECPKCKKQYEHKYTFRKHLIKVHQIPSNELAKLVFKIKSTRQIIKQDIAETSSGISSNEISTAKQTVENGSPVKRKAAKQKYKYSCPKCQKVCSSKMMLNDHINANCGREPQYACSICTKKFFSASTLNCHMTIHTGELPHKCSYCDKRFRTRGQVTVHHRTHTGERPFACQICNQSFTHRETLISHLSRHIGMKRYKCYGCEKQFSSISGLKMHREIRPDTCGKVKFNSRALGPRVRVVQGTVIFEPQPAINPYLRTEDPQLALAEVQNTMAV